MGLHDRATIPHDMQELARAALEESDVRPTAPATAVPWLVVTYEQLRPMPLDPRAGFIVSLIDGRATVEMIIDMAGFPEGEARTILGHLLHLGAIALR